MRPPSLTRHLVAWALGALLLVWGTFIGVGYHTGAEEAEEVADGQLATVSALVLAYGRGPSASTLNGSPPPRLHDYQQSISIVVWDSQGRLLARMGDAPLPAFDTPDGFTTLRLGNPASAWRALSRWNEPRDRRVTVLMPDSERLDLAHDIAGHVVEPGAWLLPVVALLLVLAIHRGLRPLRKLARDVDALDVYHAQPLSTPAHHDEILSMVGAINTLVARYTSALARERALANEFAHELRTPLASLALQARAVRGAQGEERRQLLEGLERDALRSGEVLSHLLALARASRTELDEHAQPVALQELASRVVAELAPTAGAAAHELGLSGGGFTVVGHPVLLELALRNLIENALSHTPPGTQVDVRLDAAHRVLEVCDSPGADSGPAEVQAWPKPALGLGLGHRVVEKVAAIHHARFAAELHPGGVGRCYRITFAAAQE